jgi:hypothetical protein
VYEDGVVVYRGTWDVREHGYRYARLSARELDELRTGFRSLDFLQFPYRCANGGERIDDAPGARIFYREGAKARLIDHQGCTLPTAELDGLEDRIDKIVGTACLIDGGRPDLPGDDREYGAGEGALTVPGVVVEDGREREPLPTDPDDL